MVHCPAAITPKAPNSALVMQVEVSTLPATTEAGGLGLSIEPGGMMTLSGFRQPAFSGMSSSTSVRKTYSTAAMHTAVGALKLLVCCADVPVKSISALRVAVSTRIATLICAPLSSGRVNSPFLSRVITRRTDSSALFCTCTMYACTMSRPYWSTILRSSCRPFSLAAICAFKSAMFCCGFLEGYSPLSSNASICASCSTPCATSFTLLICTPSSSIRVENGGIEPGVVPPMSA